MYTLSICKAISLLQYIGVAVVKALLNASLISHNVLHVGVYNQMIKYLLCQMIIACVYL
jgi:hypothetical protein